MDMICDTRGGTHGNRSGYLHSNRDGQLKISFAQVLRNTGAGILAAVATTVG
jgi:hypothetical protein